MSRRAGEHKMNKTVQARGKGDIVLLLSEILLLRELRRRKS